MLRVIQNRAASSAKSYYSRADYLSEGQELVGRWGGKAAQLMGLEGEVGKREFERLCDNQHPLSGKKLTPRTDSDRTVGYDLNFHVPKGVSLAYSLNQDDRILTAFRESVRETMSELEEEMRTRVRVGGRDQERTTGNLAYAEFVHFTARPVDSIPDPHLHAHCFVFNTTFDSKENRFKAGQFREIKRDAPYFEAAFAARLARRLEKLGYGIERTGKKWDLAGLPKGTTAKFSRRTAQIEKLAAEKGVNNPNKKSQLGAKTREKKQAELSLAELREIWRQRLSDSEREALESLAEKNSGSEAITREEAAKRSLKHAIEHCFERNSVVPKRELLAEALRHGVDQVDVEEFQRQLPQHDVIVREVGGRELATTSRVLAEERNMLDFARVGKGKAKPLNSQWKIRRQWLNEGQQNAIKHVLSSRDLVVSIKGDAGTGKTSLMQEAVEAIRAGGREVFAFAPSAEASRNVLRSEGFENATTVAELLVNTNLQKEARGQVLWIDEAGLLGSRTMKQVFDVAKELECRVIFSGDWKQHSSVERGAAMRLLEQEAGIRPAVVTSIQRQKGRYRDAVAAVAAGRVGVGFDELDALGWVKELPDEERNAAIAKDYGDGVAKNENILVVSPTHLEGEALTTAIRQELKSRKLLGIQDRRFLRLTPLHFTEAERADSARYQAGDVIQFHQNAKGFKKGQRVVVRAGLSRELAAQAKHFQVYRSEEIALAAGDRVRVTATGRTKDGKHRLNNGTLHQVAGFTESGDLRLKNGWVVDANFGLLAPGYVVTSHASQGKTNDRVILAESSYSLRAASRQQFYVSMSRARHNVTVYTDCKSSLREAIHASDGRMSATELVGSRDPQALLGRIVAHSRILANREQVIHKVKDRELGYDLR